MIPKMDTISCKMNIAKQWSGSSLFEYNGTRVYCTINGPIDCPQRHEDSEKAYLEISWRESCLEDAKAKDYYFSSIVEKVLEKVVILELDFLKMIQVSFYIVEKYSEEDRENNEDFDKHLQDHLGQLKNINKRGNNEKLSEQNVKDANQFNLHKNVHVNNQENGAKNNDDIKNEHKILGNVNYENFGHEKTKFCKGNKLFCALNASLLALINAGIPLNSLFYATSSFLYDEEVFVFKYADDNYSNIFYHGFGASTQKMIEIALNNVETIKDEIDACIEEEMDPHMF